jgi:PAS domain S-box-containing protein
VSVVAYITISNQLTTKTVNQIASIAVKQNQKINALLESKQEDVLRLANQYDLQAAINSYDASTTKNSSPINAILSDKETQDSAIQSIYLTSESNTVYASTTADVGAKATVQGNTKAGQENSITIQPDPSDGIDTLYISTPMIINQVDVGRLTFTYDIDDFVATIQDYTGLGNTGDTIVAAQDDSGHTISLFPLRFNAGAALSTRLDSLQLFNHVGSTYHSIDYNGHSVMVSVQPVAYANWVTATTIDTSEEFQPIMQLRDTLILIVIASVIVITLIALYVTQIITSPILRIAAASKRIGTGDFDTRVEEHRHDEIGTLADSINLMGASLKSFVSGIESQRNHLSIILNSTNDSILTLDRQGLITTANRVAAELVGLNLNDVIGKPMNHIFRLTSGSQPLTIFYNAAETKTYSNVELIDSAGQTHFLKLIVARLDSNQAGDQNIITIRDETKNRELENMKVDFVSMAAHELRTPLAAIRGYIELVKMKQTDESSEISGYLNKSLSSAAELGSLINNLLGVSRIERGTLTLNMEKSDLAASVTRAVTDVGFTARDKHIDLKYNGPKTGYLVSADESALREVIANLLNNAINYTPSGGSVIAELKQDGLLYRVSVKDTGIGIPAAAVPNLFTKFFRVKGGLDSGNKGTGLGLFIAKSIIERHGGTISVESKEGAGSTFSFTIPILTPEKLAAMQAKEQDQGIKTGVHHGWVTKNINR